MKEDHLTEKDRDKAKKREEKRRKYREEQRLKEEEELEKAQERRKRFHPRPRPDSIKRREPDLDLARIEREREERRQRRRRRQEAENQEKSEEKAKREAKTKSRSQDRTEKREKPKPEPKGSDDSDLDDIKDPDEVQFEKQTSNESGIEPPPRSARRPIQKQKAVEEVEEGADSDEDDLQDPDEQAFEEPSASKIKKRPAKKLKRVVSEDADEEKNSDDDDILDPDEQALEEPIVKPKKKKPTKKHKQLSDEEADEEDKEEDEDQLKDSEEESTEEALPPPKVKSFRASQEKPQKTTSKLQNKSKKQPPPAEKDSDQDSLPDPDEIAAKEAEKKQSKSGRAKVKPVSKPTSDKTVKQSDHSSEKPNLAETRRQHKQPTPEPQFSGEEEDSEDIFNREKSSDSDNNKFLDFREPTPEKEKSIQNKSKQKEQIPSHSTDIPAPKYLREETGEESAKDNKGAEETPDVHEQSVSGSDKESELKERQTEPKGHKKAEAEHSNQKKKPPPPPLRISSLHSKQELNSDDYSSASKPDTHTTDLQNNKNLNNNSSPHEDEVKLQVRSPEKKFPLCRQKPVNPEDSPTDPNKRLSSVSFKEETPETTPAEDTNTTVPPKSPPPLPTPPTPVAKPNFKQLLQNAIQARAEQRKKGLSPVKESSQEPRSNTEDSDSQSNHSQDSHIEEPPKPPKPPPPPKPPKPTIPVKTDKTPAEKKIQPESHSKKDQTKAPERKSELKKLLKSAIKSKAAQETKKVPQKEESDSEKEHSKYPKSATPTTGTSNKKVLEVTPKLAKRNTLSVIAATARFKGLAKAKRAHSDPENNPEKLVDSEDQDKMLKKIFGTSEKKKLERQKSRDDREKAKERRETEKERKASERVRRISERERRHKDDRPSHGEESDSREAHGHHSHHASTTSAKRDKPVKENRHKKKNKGGLSNIKIDTSRPLDWPATPETILEYHKAKPFLTSNEEWLLVELNEYECLVENLEIVRLMAKASKFFEIDPDELFEEFFEFVDEVPSYDEIINWDVWQEFRDKRYPC